MIKFDNTITPSPDQWKSAIMGARNAMNSWDRSDSVIECVNYDSVNERDVYEYQLGLNDYNLLKRLRNAGTADHRKYMRMLPVMVDITAPLYWWPEFDQYKIGTVTNSCSKMHTIHKTPITEELFSFDHTNLCSVGKQYLEELEKLRIKYNETKDKKYWYALIQLLPEGFNQKRTVMLNYEVLANIYKSRQNHKLDEWRELCKWIESLPYFELITGIKNTNEQVTTNDKD